MTNGVLLTRVLGLVLLRGKNIGRNGLSVEELVGNCRAGVVVGGGGGASVVVGGNAMTSVLVSEHSPGYWSLQLVPWGHTVQAGPMLYMGVLMTLPAVP